MKTNLTILAIVVASLLGAGRWTWAENAQRAQQDSGVSAAAGGETTYQSYIGDLDPEGFAQQNVLDVGWSDGQGKQKAFGTGPVKGGDACSTHCSCLSCKRDLLFRRSFGSLEYMHWYSKGRSLPPLVTTSPQGTGRADAGVLRRPDTRILFGGEKVGTELQAAGRLTAGLWLDEQGERAVMARGWGVEGRAAKFNAASEGDPILARPFFNVDPLVNAPDALLVAIDEPGFTRQGNIGVSSKTDVLGGELLLRTLLDTGRNYRLDLISGFQFSRIDDDLTISTFIDAGANTFTLSDAFDVQNRYSAGELGLLAEIYRGCMTFSALGKIAVGNMDQRARIRGQSTISNGGEFTAPGGLLTQPTDNIGRFERDILAWSPEASFKLSYAATERTTISVGYTFMYYTRASFAGDLVDTRVDATQLFGQPPRADEPRPRFDWKDTDFWIQTVDLGLHFNY